MESRPQRLQANDDVEIAIALLRKARDLMISAEHPHAAERIRLALSSAYGARRIEDYRRGSRPRRPPPKNVARAVRSRLNSRPNGKEAS